MAVDHSRQRRRVAWQTRSSNRPKTGYRPLATFACVAAVGAALVGCGGGGSSISTPQLSKQEFVSQANAICRQANNELRSLQAPTDLAGVASFASQIEPIAKNLLEKLSALEPPDELRSQYSEYLKTTNTQLERFPDLIAAAEAGDQSKTQAISNEIDASNGNPIATNLGLTECAKNVQPQG